MPRYCIAPRLATGVRQSSSGHACIIAHLNAKEAAARQAELSSDVIVEEERIRWQAPLHPLTQQDVWNMNLPHGICANVELQVTLNGQPLEAAVVTMSLYALRGGMGTTSVAATDSDGRATLLYDCRIWSPSILTVTPRFGAWASYATVTSPRMTLALVGLPQSGPLGWWHNALGLTRYSPDLGSGIRVGIIDAGIGPHPYLAHAKRAGAIIAGEKDQSGNATDDVAEHGTHVAGVIGARPTESRDFAGIAPGADLVALRVYPGGGPLGAEAGFATSGDISQAITQLSQDDECDIINISSGGLLRSEIESDRIAAAFNRGTLVVCAAGNGGGPPVMFPASDPNTVGVSAMGMLNTTPPTGLDAFSMPVLQDRYTMGGGAYLAAFSSFGPEVRCIAPGVGIISTVPTSGDLPTRYLAASGTSVAAPVVTGTLAALLSRDAAYKSLPRNQERTLWAWNVLARTMRSLGLSSPYQGFGLPTIFS